MTMQIEFIFVPKIVLTVMQLMDIVAHEQLKLDILVLKPQKDLFHLLRMLYTKYFPNHKISKIIPLYQDWKKSLRKRKKWVFAWTEPLLGKKDAEYGDLGLSWGFGLGEWIGGYGREWVLGWRLGLEGGRLIF